MDENRKSQRGSPGRRRIASNYLLELFPDTRSYEARRRRTYNISDTYQPLSAGEEQRRPGLRASLPPPDLRSLSQISRGGGGGGGGLVLNKKRVSQTKRRSLSSDQSTAGLLESSKNRETILITESPLNPGVPIVYRTPEEKSTNPDRLTLDRRQLTICPVLEGEEKLRLLNLQHNSITRLENLGFLHRLVFLDLYNNFIREMSGLENLLCLRVLMLGKNRIGKITGLKTLTRLDVLDLHGNQVKEIENLCHLVHLRVLNLAGNEITVVAGVTGLISLAELNLRRNRVTHVYEIDQLPNLRRLFLSHNLIQSFSDMSCLSGSRSILELNLDGNPLANQPEHRSSIIYHVNNLNSLNQSSVLEEERVEAAVARRGDEEKMKQEKQQILLQEHKEAAVVAIQRAWDKSHINPIHSTSSHINPLHSISYHTLSTTITTDGRHPPLLSSTSLPRLLPTFLVDVAPPTLHLYGNGALETLDIPPRAEQPLTLLHIHCVEFSEVVPWLKKIGRGFPELKGLCLECTNMTTLDEINHLVSLPSTLHTLTITPHSNPLTLHPLFTHYTLYRLQHLQLSVLNHTPVTNDNLAAANRIFSSLSSLRPHNHSSSPLRPTHLLRRAKKESGTRSCVKRITDTSYSPETDKEDHQWRKAVASSFTTSLHSATLEAHKKLTILDKNWTAILAKLIRASLREYSDIDRTMADIFNHL